MLGARCLATHLATWAQHTTVIPSTAEPLRRPLLGQNIFLAHPPSTLASVQYGRLPVTAPSRALLACCWLAGLSLSYSPGASADPSVRLANRQQPVRLPPS